MSAVLRFQAASSLLQRYARVACASWKQRKTMTAPARDELARQFLPAVLEIQESPPHPLGRALIWLLASALVAALIWSVAGRVEIVAVAPGQVVGDGRTKVVQPLEAGVIRRILVRNGQHVVAGEVLVELDSTQTTADASKSEDGYFAAALEAARARALIRAIRNHAFSPLTPPAGAPAEMVDTERRMLESQWAEFCSKVNAQDAEIAKREAELSSSQHLVAKLEETLPLVQQRASDLDQLRQAGYISQHGFLEREQVRIETGRDLAYQRGRIKELEAAIAAGKEGRRAITAEFDRTAVATLTEAEKKTSQSRQDSIKAKQKQLLTSLRAPVSGTVQQLAIYTEGGVVQPAQALLQVVPENDLIEVEAVLENKDIGFVKIDQAATLKVDTFPFTKYGTLPGRVTFVSQDAVRDEKRGLLFIARVRLSKTELQVDNHSIKVSPGMTVTAEIKTGERRVIDYLLSPVLEVTHESLRER